MRVATRSALLAGGTLALVVAASGIAPHDRGLWLAENVLTLVLAVWLALTARSFPLAPVSYGLVLGFLALHAIGAHFTYPRVPYDRLAVAWTGTSIDAALGFERNHWDRLVHAAFGVAFAVPLREVARRIVGAAGFWSYALPVALVMAIALLYEFVEWGVASAMGVGPASGFLGAQGDPWDAHHDLLLASVGATVSMAVAAGRDVHRDRVGFVRAWRESVRVKGPPGS